ncbi:MAG: cytochrome c biogenesis heme-transporting ATPase CcmA [Gammaproteobacteria bacterium]
MPESSSLTLSAHQVSVWRGERCLCRDLNFALHGGEALHLQGINGAGKTSLIRVLTGLGRCDAGEVRWCGAPLRRLGPEYRAAIAYVGHSNGVNLGLSPRENLRAAGALAQIPSGAAVQAALDEVHLGSQADSACATLSMGQRRRTALARLLLTRGPLWFLDEPLASLDVSGVAWLSGVLRAHLAGGGLAVYATHQALDLAPHRVQALALKAAT